MHSKIILFTAFICLFCANTTFAQPPTGGLFDWQCYYDPDSTSGLSGILDDDTVGVLVIIARGWGDCFNQGNDPLPAWSNRLFDPNDPESLSRFYDDNSHGQVHLTGTVARPLPPAQDSCFYTHWIPCHHYWWGCGCDCEYIPAVACTSWAVYDSMFQDICRQVDAAYDLRQFDLNYDHYVDFVLWINYPWGNMGFSPGVGESYWSAADSEWVSNGCTMYGGNNYYQVLGLAAHEVGHAIGGPIYAPDWTHVGLTDYNHNAIGSFDVMSGGGFWVGDSIGYPSLFNPWSRCVGLNWVPVDTINRSTFDLDLQPYVDTRVGYSGQGTAYKLPSPTDANQYFLITSHSGFSQWETYWPSRGILAWRFKGDWGLAPRANRKLKIESASGLWDWDIVRSCSWRSSAVRTDTANAAAGYDSLDFPYTVRDVDSCSDMWAHSVGYLGVGGVGQFFSAGMQMDDHTNPTSRTRTNQGPDYPRAVNSGIALRNIRETTGHNYTADLIVNAWQGTMTQNHTWFDTVNVVGNLTVASGATLTILRGTKILADSGVTITISGQLIVNGTETDSVRFMAAPGVTQWGGIHVDGGRALVSYAVIKDAFLPFWSENAAIGDVPVQLSDVRIIGGGNGLRIWGSAIRTHVITNVIVQDVPDISTYAGLYFMNTKIQATNLRVINSGYRTGYIVNTTGTLANSYFNGPTDSYGLCFSGATSGLVVTCTDIDHIAPPGTNVGASVWCINQGNPIFGMSNPAFNNRIVDDQSYLVRFSGLGAKPVLGGYNNILIQENLAVGHRCFKWDSYDLAPGAYNARNIYWGGGVPQLSYFDPANAFYWDWRSYLTVDPGLCGQGQGGNGFASAFDSALALEAQEQFAEAQAAYLSIAENTDYAVGDRTTAAARAVMVDRQTQTLSVSDVSELSATLEASASDLSDSLSIERVTFCHLTDEAAYQAALDGYENWLSRDLSEEDSLLTLIDIYHVQMLAQGGGNLDAPVAPANPAFAIHSTEHGVHMVNAAMNALMGITTSESVSAIPTAYALYQNYPNPFNPTTEIRFDLPEAVDVQLKIFNALGQEVATLIDGDRVAGAYQVQWDASSAASGIYVYQLKAGDFVDSKKMILLR